jgi:hypothetical protein
MESVSEVQIAAIAAGAASAAGEERRGTYDLPMAAMEVQVSSR